jgi:hypothetical protein
VIVRPAPLFSIHDHRFPHPMKFRRVHAPGTERATARQGFALLITITLLAFLVLLLVSLASLTRVETQVAGNTQKISQARQNALVALNLALGQLQKYAGPDQRVTARADLGDASNLNGVAAPADGKRQWVGVWGNGNAPAANTGAPVLLNWLVSGNESASFDATNGAPPYSNVSGVTFASTAAVTSLATGSDASSVLGTTAQEWRLLVGANSVGGDVTRYVAAPLMPITSPTAQIPWLGGASGETTIGRYAWWVGDENVKARVNLYNPHLAGPADELGASFVVAQRSAGEWLDRAGGGSSLGALYPALASSLADVISRPQLALGSADPTVMTDASRERFHDISMHSFSVLADARMGGLKKDLNRALAADAPRAVESARGASYAPPSARDWLFTPNNSGADSYGVPTWGLLRAPVARQVSPGGTVVPSAPVRASAGGNLFYDDAGVYPVITYAGVGMDFTSPGSDTGAIPAPAYPSPINLNLFPVVVLWNPYSVAMSGGDYTVAIGVRTASQLQLREGSTSGPVRVALYLNRANFASSGANAYFRFKLVCPPIPAGESVVFMLAGDTTYQPGLTEIVPGLNTSASAVMDTGQTLADVADAEKNYVSYATNGTGTAVFGGGEIDAILAAFDPSGAEPSGSDPETAATAWYAVAQRVGSAAAALPAARALNPDSTTSDLMFGVRVRFNFPDSGSGLKLQWIAHGSARSPLMVRTKLDSWFNGASTAGYSSSYAGRFGAPTTTWPDFSTTVARASVGSGLAVSGGSPTNGVLWEFPVPESGLLSVGQLQHAPVSILGAYPSYAVGNSLADFRVPRTDTLTTVDSHPPTSGQQATARINTYYDLSWQLNRALWDRYFFSSVPTGAVPAATTLAAWTQLNITNNDPLPNSRLHYFSKNGSAPSVDQLRYDNAVATSDPYNQAAANLLVAGGFNVNSTSAQAWRAVLGGVNQLAYNPQTQAAGAALQAAFSRFAVPTADSALATPWEGYRQLTEAQIAQLATNIVAEVKKRGPFLSLSDFVNRRLAADETGLKGALQAAIDASTTGNAANLNTTAPFNAARVDTAPGTGEVFDAAVMRNDASASSNAAHRSRSAFAPKFLTQADVLSTLGPVLTARSDTFIIRTYGETVNPLLTSSDSGYVTGRAWCEAVVQRTPEYVDQTDPALAAGNLGDALLPASTNQINREFGRRFRVVSFRWINPSDI